MRVLVAILICPAILVAAEPLKEMALPKVEALLLTGQVGVSKSEITRSLLLVGDHLYVSGEPGLQTVDVSTAGVLKLTGDWKPTSHKVNGAASKGKYLYVANWSPGAGLLVFDISMPAKPKHVKTIATTAHTWTADIYGDLLYVGIDDGQTTGINTYDLSDPAQPRLASFIDVCDRLVGNVARHEHFLYFAHQRWVYIYDGRDPGAPQRVGKIEFKGLAGKTVVHDGHLFVVSRKLKAGEEGGVTAFNLREPDKPKRVAHWHQEEPRDLCFTGNRAIVPCSGSGIYALRWRPAEERLDQTAHFYVSWPNTGKHGGYPVAVAARGDRIYIGTTGGNNPECEDFSCPYRGGRVYSVRMPEN
jgi:hypothetical protein